MNHNGKGGTIPNKLYGQIEKNVPIPSVDILFFTHTSPRHVLLGKRQNSPLKNQYYSIGGRVWINERSTSTAVRKAKEELGLKIDPQQLVFGGTMDEIFYGQRHNTNVFYGYELNPKTKIKLDTQHSECRWFKVMDQSLHPYLKQKVRTTLVAMKKKRL